MRRAMIAALLVIASALASSLWSKLECPCRATQAEIATVIASFVLRCAQEQLLHSDSALLALQGVLAQQQNAEGSPFPWTSIVVNVFLDPAVANFGSSQRASSFVLVSISW
jgi:hypothetical protein